MLFRFLLDSKRDNKRIVPCVHRNVIFRDVQYANNKWGLEKIQGIESNDKYDLARDLYLKIEQQDVTHVVASKSGERIQL